MSPDGRVHRPPEDLDGIVEEIIARRPWRGFWYLLFYPIRRFPLFFFTVLPAWASAQPLPLTLGLAAVTLWADWTFVLRHSWDMAPHNRAFVTKICRAEEVGPVVTRSHWKAIGRATLYGVPALVVVAAGAFAVGTYLEHEGLTDGAAMRAVKYVCLAIPYAIFAPLILGATYFWPMHRFPGASPELEGLKYRSGHFDLIELHNGGYLSCNKKLIGAPVCLMIGICCLYVLYKGADEDQISVSITNFIIGAFSFFLIWTTAFSVVNGVGLWKARTIATEYIRITKERGDPA